MDSARWYMYDIEVDDLCIDLVSPQHGSGRVCPASSGSRSRFALTSILEPQRAVTPGSNPPWRGLVHRLEPEATFLGECRRSHFWECRPCLGVWAMALRLDPPKKGLVPYPSGWSDGRQIPIWSGASRLWTYLKPQGAVPPGFNPPWRG